MFQISRSKLTAVLVLALLIASVPALAGSHKKHAASKDIVETAISAGSFETLVAAVQAAGLVETLQGDGPFTVFAPTDEAFAKLPAGTVETLLKPENLDQLKGILTYHVVSGAVSSEQAAGLDSAPTVNGKNLTIAQKGGQIRIDSATVVTADIECENGVIHVIDTVLIPQDDAQAGP